MAAEERAMAVESQLLVAEKCVRQLVELAGAHEKQLAELRAVLVTTGSSNVSAGASDDHLSPISSNGRGSFKLEQTLGDVDHAAPGTSMQDVGSDGVALTLRLREHWVSNSSMGLESVHGGSHNPSRHISQARSTASRGNFGSGWASRIVLSPTSMKRMVWDIMSSFVILYDLITLPLQAFAFDETLVAWYSSFITAGFWTADMLMSFVVGYHREDGIVEMRLIYTAAKYLTTWFPMDVIVVVVEWSLLAAGTDGPAQNVGVVRAGKSLRLLRIARMIRMIRLLRVMKLSSLYEELTTFVLWAPLVTLMAVARLLLGLAFIVHYIACAWYAVGVNSDNPAQSWLAELEQEQASQPYEYLIAFHWSMAQFTPAPNNFHPVNWRERLFATSVLFLGLVLFSSLLGNITALINQSRIQAFEKFKAGELIRRFFSDNNISQETGNRINAFLKGNKSRKRRVVQSDVPVLKSLPASLQIELHYEVYGPAMAAHPLYLSLDEIDDHAFRDICHSSISEETYIKGDEPFQFQTEATGMYLMSHGMLKYYPHQSSYNDADPTEARTIEQDAWLSEAALWCHWQHNGLPLACDDVKLLYIASASFSHAAKRATTGMFFLRGYASLFAERLREEHGVQGVDDTFRPFVNEAELNAALADAGSTFVKTRGSFEKKKTPAFF